MLASPATSPPTGDGWVFEPKYDGVRVLAVALDGDVALITRNGNDKTPQFPEIATALAELASAHEAPLVLDGEIVAVAPDGTPRRFESLQGRIHAMGAVDQHDVAFIAFDVLVDGDQLLVAQPWSARRIRLERIDGLLDDDSPSLLRRSRVLGTVAGDALRRATREGWEGVMAKRADAVYTPGVRSRDWLKLKIEQREELVIGGFTAPQGSRTGLGALLLGYYAPDGRLVYAGHTGTGFDRRTLEAVHRRLMRLVRRTSPFDAAPRTNAAATWVRPELVAEIKFNEWTSRGRLRQPVFVGLRDDKDARDVVRADPEVTAAAVRRPTPRRASARASAAATAKTTAAGLRAIEGEGDEGEVGLPGGGTLALTHLLRIVFPRKRRTKAQVLGYYASVAPYILPALADRPLVLKRYPNGITAPAFYQQEAPRDVPPGVRVELVADPSDPSLSPRRRFIGGDLATLLYTVQLGAISADPWHSRVGSLGDADYAIVDLDPGPTATFGAVRDVARWTKDELDAMGIRAVLKTSGASGLHVVIPFPPGIPNEAARLLAELVATRVVHGHERLATIERRVSARPPGAVYVDYLQNIRGKTVASVYALRAEPDATVSTPLRWEELDDALDPRRFTIDTMLPRLAAVGDLWAEGMRRVNSVDALLEYLAAARAAR